MNEITVKEALRAAADHLGMYERIEGYLNGTSSDAATEVEALLRCFNIVESELAFDYLPLYAEETVESETGVVPYAQLSGSVVRVVNVEDEWGNQAPFRLFPTYLKTQGGRLKIRYTYSPTKKNLNDESDYHLHVSARLFGYGIAAEYSLALGLFEESAVWDKKYKDAIAAVYNVKPCRVIRSRRWV